MLPVCPCCLFPACSEGVLSAAAATSGLFLLAGSSPGLFPEQCQGAAMQGTGAVPCSVLTATSRDAVLASKNTALHISLVGHFGMARGKLSPKSWREKIQHSYSLGPFVKLLRNVLNFLHGFFKAVFFPRPKKAKDNWEQQQVQEREGKRAA